MANSSVISLLENRLISKVKTSYGNKWTIKVHGMKGQIAVVRLVNYFLENSSSKARIHNAQKTLYGCLVKMRLRKFSL